MKGDKLTKIIALGIGRHRNVNELESMASEPQDRTVILVKDFSSLTDVEQLLINISCNGRYFY